MNPPIRAIVSNFSRDFSHASIESVLIQRPFAFACIIGESAEPRFYESMPESQQEWFCSSTVRGALYPGVHWNEIMPLDEELIESMRHAEVLFMETMQRQEWKYAIPYEERKRRYLLTLRFWNDYVQRNRINLYLAAWLPHEVPDVVIYHLCKLKNIPILYFHMSTERDTAFIEHDIENSAVQIGERYEALLKEYSNVHDPEAIPLSPRFAERYKVLTAVESQKPPLQSLKMPTYRGQVQELLIKKPFIILKYLALYCTPQGIARAARTLERRTVIRERTDFYNQNAITPDLTKPYVYLALHFQPEASTVPMAGAYNRQILIAQMLDAALPAGALIYVKEHPKESSWICRTKQDYENFLKLPKVRLVDRTFDTFALREHCKAVATATGSVGFEGIFRAKPCFMFGHRFHQYARGIYRIHSNADLRRAVSAVFEKSAAPTLVESRLYLKAMEDTGVHGTVNPWDHKISHLTDEEHTRANSDAILSELKEMEKEIARVA